jgi:DNA-binding Lrp family transcriptional regulator
MKKLDKVDQDILRALFDEADVTNKDLALKLNIAISTCQERVKKLKMQGIIKGYFCDIHFPKITTYIEAMASIKMVKHTETLANQLRDDLLKLPEVIQIFHIGGENDFNIHLAVATTADLRKLIFQELTARSCIKNVETSLIFDHQRSHVLPKIPNN